MESGLSSEVPSQVTDLLARWRGGDRQALDSLIPLVYEELRVLARHYLRGERPDHTLQSTALVHEAFVRLAGQNPPDWKSRAHFFGVAARLMRQILVDHARDHKAAKRGGDSLTITISEELVGGKSEDIDLLALDAALNSLAEVNPQQGRIVELRYFSGLTIEDTSEVLGVSPATVKRSWTAARAWLYREMNRSAQPRRLSDHNGSKKFSRRLCRSTRVSAIRLLKTRVLTMGS
jgi:RNA polymerase sigma factor (TIGR02999 family)